jgi:hypothetical protein
MSEILASTELIEPTTWVQVVRAGYITPAVLDALRDAGERVCTPGMLDGIAARIAQRTSESWCGTWSGGAVRAWASE